MSEYLVVANHIHHGSYGGPSWCFNSVSPFWFLINGLGSLSASEGGISAVGGTGSVYTFYGPKAVSSQLGPGCNFLKATEAGPDNDGTRTVP